MALIHRADLHPTKLELLSTWLPGRSWYEDRPGTGLERVAAYRFDDPAGAVGIETMLVRAGTGPVYQVPLTYRGTPLDGHDAWLIGTMDHSVLGKRWVYDGCGDPVYAATLATALLAGTGQAEQVIEIDGGTRRLAPSMTISADSPGSDEPPRVGHVRHVADGHPTIIATDAVELVLLRRLDVDDSAAAPADAVLTGAWREQAAPVPLAWATVSPLPVR